MILRLALSLLLFCTFSLGGELYLSEKEEYQLSYRLLHYFEDRAAEETIDTITERSFRPLKTEIPSFGFTDSVFWFKITLHPDSDSASKSWWLTIDYPLIGYLEIYGFQGDESKPVFQKTGGYRKVDEKRELDQHRFVFALNELSTPLTLYVRVKTDGSMQVPMQIKTSKTLFEDSQLSQLLFGFYYGVFMIIFLYNLIMYIYTKENDYLRYLFFIISIVGWQLTLNGFGLQYIWSEWDWMVEHGGAFWISLGLFSTLVFSRYFLQTENHLLWIDLLLRVLTVGMFILLLLSIFLPYGMIIPITAVFAIIIALILWVSGIMTWSIGYRPARFYVVGWSVFLLGTVLLALNKLNMLHGFYLLNYAQQIGSALEMIFLSWGLADRVKLLQDEYVDKLSKLNSILQDKVREALEHAREKDKVMMNQSRLAALGEMIEQIAHQWRQPLNTMALINQDMYIKQQLGQLNDDDFERSHDQINDNLQYMSRTINDFRNMHMSEKEEEHFALEEVIEKVISLNDASLKYAHITCSVESAGEHYIKSYKNELLQILMNLIKNSRDAILEREQKDGHINISITEDSRRFTIRFQDNGGGIGEENIKHIFEPYFTTKDESKGSGIGLYMSRAIIEEKLHGSIDVENTDEGVRFTITIPKPE